MSNDSFDKGFRDKLGYFSAPPSESLWEEIEKELDRKKNKKAIFLFTRIAAVLLPVAALIIGVRLIIKQPSLEDNTPIIGKTEIFTEKPDTSGRNVPEENIFEQQTLKSVGEENNYQTELNNTPDLINILFAKTSSKDSGFNSYFDSGNNPIDQLAYLEILEATKLPDTPVLIASVKPLTEPMSQKELHEYTVQAIENKKESKPTKIQLGASGGPLYTSGMKENIPISDNSSITSSGMLAYSGGMNILIKPWKKVSVETGVYYAKHSIQNEISSPVFANSNTIELNYLDDKSWEVNGAEIITNPIDPDPNSYTTLTEEDFQLEEVFNLIEIPVVFKYRLIDRKFDINMIYSIGALYEVSRTLNYNEDLIAINTPTGYETNQKMNLGNSIGFGLDIPLQNRFIFNIEPQAKYYLLSKNSLFLKNDNNYSLNLMLGIKYRF